MKDTKLLRALSTLDKEEWMSFRKFLLMNTGDDSEIYSLFKILQSRKSNYAGLKKPEKFRKKYYPNLSQRAFCGMQSKLYKWLEEWLSQFEMNIDEYEKEVYLVKALLRKGLFKEANSVSTKLKKKIVDSNVIDFKINKLLGDIDHVLYYKGKIDTAEERHQFLISASKKNAISYKEKTQFYLAELANRNFIYQKDFGEIQQMLSESCQAIEGSKLSKYGSDLTNLIQNENGELLQSLQLTLLNGKFKKDSELEELMNDYLFICTRRLWSRNKLINKELIYPVLNYNFRRETEKSGGKITQVRFHNTVDSIAHFLSFDEVKMFIDQWNDYVETPNRDETKDLAYSQLYFIKRDFDQMIKYSRFIAFDNYGQRTRAWLHNVICQFVFRKEDYNLAKQSLISFKNYIKRNQKKGSKNFYLANYNVAVIMEKLIKNDFKPQQIDLNDYKYIFYRSWMLEEVEKLKRK